MTQPEIQQEIEQTRERLGQTVEELVAKTDLKARARDKAADLQVQARDKAADLQARARDKAADLQARARDQATELSARVRQSQIVQRRWPLAVAAGGLVIAASVAFWRRRTR